MDERLARLIVALDAANDGSDFATKVNNAIIDLFRQGKVDYDLDADGKPIIQLTPKGGGRDPH